MVRIWSHELNYMNKRRSQIRYYVNNLTLTHYCQIHLRNSLPSPYYLPSLPLYFLLFLIPVPLLPSSYTVCSFLPCAHSSLYHTIFPCIFFSLLPTSFPSLYPLLPLPYYIYLYFLLFSLLPFLPCASFSLHPTSFPSLYPLLTSFSFSLYPSSSPSSFSHHPSTSSSLRSTYFPNFYP